MIRLPAALAFLAFAAAAPLAQETAPAAPPAEVVIDPAANLNTAPKAANMLTGFYATQAVIDICALTLEPAIAEGMAVDRQRLETALSLDVESASKAYAEVKADVEKTAPDCSDGSSDRQGVDAVTAIYQAQSASAAPPAQ